ncbi:hydrolase [Holzapfeliella saturejae]|uniref:hydrolase n=1 Tax=Holzapfeliella saturejae TaxID=3082953 RepID=UPI00399CB8C9
MVDQQLVSELTHAKQIITDYDNQQAEQKKEAFKAAVLAEQERQAQVKEQERLEAEKQAQLQEQQHQQEAAAQAQAQQQAAVSQAAEQTSNQGTFKLSFYDPAVLGSNMGYSGVAANLSVFPKGTKLKITLSDGTVWYRTVNDTGTFAYSNPRQLDVAMPNSQIPSAGILYATVEVVS